MPLQSRAAQGFAGAAVKIDLTLKGIKTPLSLRSFASVMRVKIDLTLKGIKTGSTAQANASPPFCVKIDLTLKGIKTR